MKKLMLTIFALVLLVGMAIPAYALAYDFPGKNWATYSMYTVQCPEGSPVTFELIAGQNTDVGSVTVWNDMDNVYVEYNVDAADVYLVETHVAVAGSLDGIPQTNKGNPIPGKFPYSACYDEEDEVTNPAPFVIPLDEYDCSDVLYIAAHAALSNGETAWSDDEDDGNPSIDVELLGGCAYADVWGDDDEPPGYEGVAGATWWFKYIVTNTGDVTLTNVTLTDEVIGDIGLSSTTLLPGDYFEIIVGPETAILGQYESMATATGDYNGTTYMDTDYVYYLTTEY